MNKIVKFSQLKKLLERMGFRSSAQPNHLTFEHQPSNTVFLFRTYRGRDAVSPANLAVVRRMLDERGLLEADRFDRLWKTPPRRRTAKGSR